MKTDRILQTALGLMLCLFGYALYSALDNRAVKVGDTAPDFSIQADNGATFTARKFGGKLLILNFWASWCPPCVDEEPTLEALEQKLGPKGLVVLGVSEDADPRQYQAFIDRFHVSYPTARQPDGSLKSRYGTIQIPESYLIDSNGKVIEKVVSEVDWTSDAMVQYVSSHL